MSLLDTIRSGVETAFAVGQEFVTVGTYLKREGSETYDPVTDEVTPGANSVPNVRFLKTASTLEEREVSPVSINDVKFIVPAVDLPGINPGENDQIQPGDGEIYNVILSKFVPGEVVHIIFGRRA